MPVLRTGIGQTYWQRLRKEVDRWHNYPGKMGCMRGLCTMHLSDIGRKVSELLPILSVYPLERSGLNAMKNSVVR